MPPQDVLELKFAEFDEGEDESKGNEA